MTDPRLLEEAPLVTVQRYLADHSPDLIDESASFTDHAAGVTLVGPDQIGTALYDWYHVAFPGAEAEPGLVTVAPHTVTLEFTFRGRNDGPLEGRPPTGRTVEVDMCAVHQVRDGRIHRIDLYYDRETLQRQLRAAPAARG